MAGAAFNYSRLGVRYAVRVGLQRISYVTQAGLSPLPPDQAWTPAPRCNQPCIHLLTTCCLFGGRLSDLSRPTLSFRPAAVWGRVERKCKPSATAGYRSKKLPGYYDFIGVLTSRLAPLWCISCAATTREAIGRVSEDLLTVIRWPQHLPPLRLRYRRCRIANPNRLSCSDSHESLCVARSASNSLRLALVGLVFRDSMSHCCRQYSTCQAQLRYFFG